MEFTIQFVGEINILKVKIVCPDLSLWTILDKSLYNNFY
jgi:hypothetical protein